jgi:DNA-binding CsgD family transcriptional regulator
MPVSDDERGLAPRVLRLDADPVVGGALMRLAASLGIREVDVVSVDFRASDDPGALQTAVARAGPDGVVLVSERAVRRFPSPSHSDRGLTGRERAVIALMADGATNVEIAAELEISVSTVKSHVAQIKRKLGAATRAMVIARYLRGPAR